MPYQGYEIVGTDKPIFKSPESYHYTYEELIHLNENPNDYEIAGYLQVVINQNVLYEMLYQKRG